ncbi:Retrovirus-related Pol polyprotein from transposon TNT 1-94 [Araneus ventricosus]|uniref:Retrovirus-related Pol polyprotein from transposon TNT 1-94 n=1 Tax=Araneus ventricosus TaxID=182803 RepID=A0A4Y2FCB3_ARAVE|nr:Retrovirus-related Pol polyprotein from transposon TNT 1-94 [Araneus ventricosus]
MHYGCWQFIIKTEPADPDEGSTYKEKYDFQLRKDGTFTLIYTNISPELKSLISDTTDGAVAWKILKDHFEPMRRARVIQILDEFFGTKYQPGEDIGIFLCRVKTAASRLQEAGHKVDDLYLGFQMIRYLPQEFQSTVQQIYRWKDGEFTAGKIEAELILEANGLQLMKQDLEKTETVFLSSASTSRKSSAVPGGADAVPGDASGNKWYQKEDGKVFVKQNKTTKRSVKKIGPCFLCKKYGHLKVNCKDKNTRQKSLNENFNTEFRIKLKFSEAECSLIELNAQSETSCNLSEEISDKGGLAATTHFCNDKSLFLDIRPVTNMQMLLAIGNKDCLVEEIGTIRFLVKNKDYFNEITLSDVLYNPKLRRNLLSGSRLEKKGAHFVGSKGKIHVYNKDWNKLFLAVRRENLYFFKPTKYITPMPKDINSVSNITSKTKSESMKIWHERFCHINNEYLVKTSKNNCVRGLPSLTDDRSHCIPCKLAKSRRVSFKKTRAVRSKRPLELLHMDLCGPMPALSQGVNKYFFAIIDDYSRKVTVFPINKKSDVFQTFLKFQRRAERFLCRKIVSVKTDGGLEFCNKDLDNFLEQQGINHEKTTRIHPNRMVLQKGKKSSVSHLKPFGCLAYVGVPKQIRKKLDMRAKLGIMVGYALHTKGYRIWLRDENKLIETINVRFDENTKGVDSSQNSNQYTKFNFTISNYSDDEGDFDTVMDSLSGRLIPERSSESPSTSREEPCASTDCSFIPCSENKWIRKIGLEVTGAGIYYGIEAAGQQEANVVEVKILTCYQQAIRSREASEWCDAMDREINVMIERKVLDLVHPPENEKVLGNRWVDTLKRDENNRAVRFKARLVAQGNTQLKGESFDEVFSPVVNFSIVRLFFSICVCLWKWTHIQVDINNAYLYANLDATVYMRQPIGL